MKLYPNGIIFQDINHPTNFVTQFNYNGLNSCHQNPLWDINDIECKKISENAAPVLAHQDGKSETTTHDFPYMVRG